MPHYLTALTVATMEMLLVMPLQYIPSLEPVSIATPLSTNGHNSTTMGECGQNLDRETPKDSNVCQPISVSPGDQDACDTSPSVSTIVSSPSASTNDPIVQ